MTHQSIQDHLHELAAERGITLLFAVESGSRAWGFPSPDSDYDVRAIYLHPQDWYLSIGERKDGIDYFAPHDGLLDVNGWDIRKALRLLAKSNATVGEWSQSPIVYYELPGIRAELLELCRRFFNPVTLLNHYRGIAHNSYRAAREGEAISVKKLLYVVRSLLAGRWVAVRNEVPPSELTQLLQTVEDRVVVDHIQELVRQKTGQVEQHSLAARTAADKFH